MTKASDNPFPSLLVQEAATDGSDFGNPAADYRRLFLGEDGALHLKDSAGAVTDIGAAVADIVDIPTAEMDDTLVLAPDGAGGVEFRAETGGSGDITTDAAWAAAGDLIVGSGNDTASVLTKGAAGGVLAMGNSAVIWNAGTSFPASKATGDRYWRTDLGMEFAWDGTRWATTQVFTAGTHLGEIGLTATGARFIAIRPLLGLPIYLIEVTISAFVATTNDGSKYWRADLERTASGGVSWNAVSQPSTAAHAADSYVITTLNPNVDVSVANGQRWRVNFVKVSTPGNINVDLVAAWRLVAT